MESESALAMTADTKQKQRKRKPTVKSDLNQEVNAVDGAGTVGGVGGGALIAKEIKSTLKVQNKNRELEKLQQMTMTASVTGQSQHVEKQTKRKAKKEGLLRSRDDGFSSSSVVGGKEEQAQHPVTKNPGQVSQNAKRMQGKIRSESNVDKIVNEEIEGFILGGKYVEYDKIRRECECKLRQQQLSPGDYAQQQRQLSLDPILRLVQEFNLEVNSVVDSYYYLTPIKIFHDCEKFVFEQMKNWFVKYKKIVTMNYAKSFADFNYGEFLQVPRVMELFKCSQLNPPLVYISNEEVVEIFMDIVMGNTSKPNSQQIGGQVKGKRLETEYIDFPVDFNIGRFIGPRGSNINSLRELTSCTIMVEEDIQKLLLRGTRECIDDAKQRILSGNSTAVDYQEKFEKILNLRLRMVWSQKFSEMNYPSNGNTGVIVDAKRLHKHLDTYWSKLLNVYDLKSKEFAKSLSERITTEWKNWFKVRSFGMLFV